MVTMMHSLSPQPTAQFPRIIRLFWLLVCITALFQLVIPIGTVASADTGPFPIRSASEIDYPPFCLVDETGNASGFSVELLRAALAAMERDVIFRTGPWAEVKGWLETGEIEALPLVGRTPEREFLFDFTFPYMSLHGAIVVRSETKDVQDLADLRGRPVAVMKGDNAEEFLRRKERGIDIHTTPTFEQALQELSRGRYDAVIIQRLVGLRLIQETGLADLRIINQPIKGFRQDFCFAVKEGDRETLALLNEGLSIITADGTYRHLHAKWFAALELPAKRRIVIGGDQNFPPFEYLDENGRPAGYNVELTRAIALAMGLDIEIHLGPWADMRNALGSGDIDALQGMFYSTKRDLSLGFTVPHIVNDSVGVSRTGESPPPSTLADLAGKRIVVQQGDIMHDFALENGLRNETSVVGSQGDALRELAGGKHDCALVSRLTAHYWIRKEGWNNLNVGSEAVLSPEYCYAVPEGHKALLSKLGEGLKVIDETGEYRRIHDKWLGVYQDAHPGFTTILLYAAMVAVPLLLTLSGIFFWSWSLRRQVAVKTQELGKSEERFRNIFEAANVGKSITLPGGELHVNKAYANFLGYTPEELQGRKWQELTPAEEIESTEKTIAPLLAGEKNTTRMEKRYVHKNGALLWADVSVAMKRNTDGTPLHFITTVIDITERKRMEKALHDSEEFQRAMIACSPVALYSTDLEGIVSSWNASAEKMFGWSANEIIGKPLPVAPDEQHKFDMLRNHILSGQDFTGKELIRRRKDGSRIPISLSVAPIRNDRGGIVGIMRAAEDITERKRAEAEQEKLQAQLLHSRKMESVGRLAGGVAHDFNNMLGVIIGNAELALERTEPSDPIHAEIEEILTAAKRSAEITRQLLAFARKQVIAPRVIDLNETVEGMLKILRRLIGEDIDLAWKPGKSLCWVKMDASQIDQILANLCVNARDAIAGVGRITMETAQAEFDEAHCIDHPGFVPGEFVQLTVSDDGRGMDRETMDNLFEPFFTTKGVGEGTGMGLATVYGIVKQNDGFINVYSEPGKGAVFKVYLPRHIGDDKETGGEIAGAGEIPGGSGETVLVVEDEEAILKLARRILTSMGYNVLAASTPAQAMKIAGAHAGPIHLLMTDVVMPGMSGRDLAANLRAVRPRLKSLFMSGYTADVIAHRGILEKGVHFIQKPFTRQDLSRKVKDALV